MVVGAFVTAALIVGTGEHRRRGRARIAVVPEAAGAPGAARPQPIAAISRSPASRSVSIRLQNAKRTSPGPLAGSL